MTDEQAIHIAKQIGVEVLRILESDINIEVDLRKLDEPIVKREPVVFRNHESV